MIEAFLQTLLSLAEPAGLVWLGLMAMMYADLRRRRWRRGLAATLLWIGWTIATCTPAPKLLIGDLEKPWIGVRADSLPEVDAVVCLGGGADPSDLEPSGVQLRDAGDRFLCALDYARQHPDLPLVLGGGAFKRQGKVISAADGLKQWLEAGDWLSNPLYSLGICANTYDEARFTAALAKQEGWSRVLIVTSGYHMNRSKAVFEKTGLELAYLPCNFLSQKNLTASSDQKPVGLPGNRGLRLFSFWWHEWVGTHVYRWRGWID